MMKLKGIGDRIRAARERLNLSQEDLALRLGKTQNAISLYERGLRAIHLSEIDGLAKALEVPISYFFGDDDPISEIMDLLLQFPTEEQIKIAARLRLELDLYRKVTT